MVYALDVLCSFSGAFAVQNDKIACLNLAIKQQIHRESKKGCHPNHGYNFVNFSSICKILSLLQTAVNFQQN